MVTLTETTEIAAPFEKLEWWVDHFEEEFVKWSPLHLECELLSGGIVEYLAEKIKAKNIEFGFESISNNSELILLIKLYKSNMQVSTINRLLLSNNTSFELIL